MLEAVQKGVLRNSVFCPTGWMADNVRHCVMTIGACLSSDKNPIGTVKSLLNMFS